MEDDAGGLNPVPDRHAKSQASLPTLDAVRVLVQ